MRAMKWLAALICASVVPGALAVSSSVQLDAITYTLKDLDPSDGIAPAVAFMPTFEYSSELQEFDVANGSLFAFTEFRCQCPFVANDAEITRSDRSGVAGRTFGPDAFYRDANGGLVPPDPNQQFLGLTPATEVTVSVSATFFADPGAHAGLRLKVVGYSLFPDGVSRQSSSIAGDSWTDGPDGLVEATFTNTGDRLSPFHFLYQMEISGMSPPIPEPESWALMALGLAVIGWRGRRLLKRR